MCVLLGMPNGPHLLPIPLLTGSGYLECCVENVSVAASRFGAGEGQGDGLVFCGSCWLSIN